MKKRVLILLFLAGLVAVALWQRDLFMTSTYDGPRQDLRIAVGSNPVFSTVYVAYDRGFFEKRGLDVELVQVTSGRDGLQMVVDGTADLGTPFETPVVLQSLAGEDLAAITELHHSNRNTGIVGRTEKGIYTPADLLGKRIGVTPATNGEFFLYLFLTFHGIPLDKVTIVETSPQDLIQGLMNDEYDAIATWNPIFSSAARTLGEEQVTTFWSDEYTETSVLVGQRAYVQENEDVVVRVLEALREAEKDIQKNEQSAFTIVSTYLDQFSEETLMEAWESFDLEIRLSNILLTVLEQEADWLVEQGHVPYAEVDFREVIYDAPLRAVAASAVTIY